MSITSCWKSVRPCLFALFSLGFFCLSFARSGTAAPPVSISQARDRVVELRAEIAEADDLYFKKAAPVITDAAYDRLKRELTGLERAFPELALTGLASDAIGDDRAGGFPVVQHRERMLSLHKSYTEAELRAFHERMVQRLGHRDALFVIEPKFDGLAISVTFERGELVRAVTRGNGDQGDDVTANVRTILTRPRTLRGTVSGDAPDSESLPERIELRGEIFIGFAEFARINAEQEKAGDATFANPRNLAAGTLKQHDPAQVAQRKLEIVFYGIGACEPASARPKTQQALHALIRKWGLPWVGNYQIARNGDEIWTAVEKIGRERSGYSYPTDGAVVKLDDVTWQREIGAAMDAPNWAIAFKFAPAQVSTRITAITVQVGRTGVLTPVAELGPITLGGSTIARATLHNFAEIIRRDIRVGDFVVVEKSGEIIPSIARVDLSRRSANSSPYRVPTTCPSCATTVVQISGEVAIRCPNSACPAQLRRRVAHFASRSGVGIEGLGTSTIDALVDAGAITSIADVYRLDAEDFTKSGGRGAARVLASIGRSKRAELWRFVNGLGIQGIGEGSAKALARRFGGLTEFAAAERVDYFAEDRCSIGGVSAGAAEAALAFFAQPQNRALITALIGAGVAPVNR